MITFALASLLYLLPGPGTAFYYDGGYWINSGMTERQMAVAGGASAASRLYMRLPVWCEVRGHLEMHDGTKVLQRIDLLVCEVYAIERGRNDELLKGPLMTTVLFPRGQLYRISLWSMQPGPTRGCGVMQYPVHK